MLNGLIAGAAVLLLAIVFLIIILAYTKADVKELQDKERKRTIDELKGGDSKRSGSVLVSAHYVTYAQMAQIIEEFWKEIAARDEQIKEISKLADLQQKEIELIFGLISRKRLYCEWTQSEFASLQEEIKDIRDKQN